MSNPKAPAKYQRSKQRNEERRAARRAAAELRKSVRGSRHDQEQLTLLDERRGESRRERARLEGRA